MVVGDRDLRQALGLPDSVNKSIDHSLASAPFVDDVIVRLSHDLIRVLPLLLLPWMPKSREVDLAGAGLSGPAEAALRLDTSKVYGVTVELRHMLLLPSAGLTMVS